MFKKIMIAAIVYMFFSPLIYADMPMGNSMGASGQGAGGHGAEQDGRGECGERDGEGDETMFGGLGKRPQNFFEGSGQNLQVIHSALCNPSKWP